MKRILILIRSFNDFDQALPIIDHIVNSSDNIVSVWSFESVLNGCDDHLKYLNDNLGVPVEYVSDKLPKLSKYIMNFHILLTKISTKSNEYPFLIPITILMSNIKPIINSLLRIGYVKLFKPYAFDVIMIDTGMDSTIHGQNILFAAKAKDICVVGYAHGYSVYSNPDSVQKGKVQLGKIKSFILKMAKPSTKRAIYANCYLTGRGQIAAQFKKTHASGHYASNELHRVKEIGMPRYTHEWNKKYKEHILHNQSFSYGDQGKLNVVLFMSHPQYNVKINELYSLINELSHLNNINFVYKPHTRKGLHLIDTQKLHGLDASGTSSVLLSEWADLGIVYGSSIGFQFLIDKVPLIIPSFVHSNKTIYETDRVTISANTLEELSSLVCRPKSEIVNLIDQNKVDVFIDNAIYGDNRDNMMDTYCSFSDCC
jgi:hypothetical protein